ncbi:hypothetical protein [Haloactinopolyspora sp.]|uniref:hypothetical protein n=1 Tax=Haloactinopolyspora sp. TaxID=1966353 RepID=UPI002631BF4E|nr:hypothetical protein [Haloactinopolyspora sp.]
MTLIAAVFAEGSTNVVPGPGVLGFLVIVFLALALVLLYRSMRKQIRKVDYNDQGVTDEERMRRTERTDHNGSGGD